MNSLFKFLNLNNFKVIQGLFLDFTWKLPQINKNSQIHFKSVYNTHVKTIVVCRQQTFHFKNVIDSCLYLSCFNFVLSILSDRNEFKLIVM